MALIRHLASRGVLVQLEDRIRVYRQGGYSGIDALVYFIFYFTAMPSGGLRGLWKLCSGLCERVGAVAGRSALMSSAAMSRLLQRVSVEEVAAFSSWLLVEASGVVATMGAGVTQWVDGQGNAFHVFAFDPVRLAIRARGLPQSSELPEPERRSDGLAAPGRAGRKRGEVVTSMGVLEHRGSGAVLDVSVSPGNGDARAMFRQAVKAVVWTAQQIGCALSSVAMVTDGEFGTVPHLTECTRAGLPLITRSARYEVLADPAVRDRMAVGRWRRVQDSGSGPTRYAVDIGTVRIFGGKHTRDDDGKVYEPVEARLIASAYASGAEDSGCGTQIGSHRVELFLAIGLDAHAFSASDTVTLFYGRCGQESAFAQHQRLLGLQRVFSTSLAGQLLAIVAAFFVWNLRLAAGTALAPPLPNRQPSERRVPPQEENTSIDQICTSLRALPDAPESQGDASLEVIAAADPANSPDASDTNKAPESQRKAPIEVIAEADPPSSSDSATGKEAPHAPRLEPRELVNDLDWNIILAQRPGWTWEPAARVLTNANGVRLAYRQHEWVGPRLKFRFGGRDEQRNVVQATINAPRRLSARHRGAPSPKSNPVRVAQRGVLLVCPAVDDREPEFEVMWPEFVVAAAIQRLTNLVRHMEVHVHNTRDRAPEEHPLVRPHRHQRQHRRLSWPDRTARRAGRGKVRIRIERAPAAIGRWVRGKTQEMSG